MTRAIQGNALAATSLAEKLAAAEGEIQRLKAELAEQIKAEDAIVLRTRAEYDDALTEHCACTHDGRGELTSECQEHQEQREAKEQAESRLAAVGETLDAMEAEIARLARLKESNGWVPAVTAYGWLKQLRVNLADGVARSWHAFRSLEAGDPMICSICGEHRYARRHHIDAMPRKARAQCDGQEAQS